MGEPWVLVILVVVVAMLGWVNLVSPRKWRLLSHSLFALRLGRQTLRDELDLQDRTLISLLLSASAVIGLFGAQLVARASDIAFGPLLWAECSGVAIAVLLVQVLLLRAMGLLFQGDGGLGEHVFALLLLWIGAGLALLPATAVVAWPHLPGWRAAAVVGGLVVLALITLLRWVRAALTGVAEGVPLRYIFIYLCALEILPVALFLQYLRASAHTSINL